VTHTQTFQMLALIYTFKENQTFVCYDLAQMDIIRAVYFIVFSYFSFSYNFFSSSVCYEKI